MLVCYSKWGIAMNKYLSMTVAALTATALPALADDSVKSKSGMATIFFGSSSCGNTLHWYAETQYAMQYANCGPLGPGVGMGFADETPRIGKNVDLGDDVEASYYRENIALNVDLALPLKTGNAFSIWVSLSGVTSFEYTSGTYSVGQPGRAGTVDRTIADKLARLLEQDASAKK
jgi:hypothetical protein